MDDLGVHPWLRTPPWLFIGWPQTTRRPSKFHKAFTNREHAAIWANEPTKWGNTHRHQLTIFFWLKVVKWKNYLPIWIPFQGSHQPHFLPVFCRPPVQDRASRLKLCPPSSDRRGDRGGDRGDDMIDRWCLVEKFWWCICFQNSGCGTLKIPKVWVGYCMCFSFTRYAINLYNILFNQTWWICFVSKSLEETLW